MPYRIFVLLALVALLAGCFFQTREPPPPELGGGCDFDFEFNDSWEDVVSNLEGALECGDANEYMKMIAQSFLYQPSPQLAAQNPSIFEVFWTRDREELFINDTFANARFRANLTVEIISGPIEDGNQITLNSRYEIQEIDADGNPIGVLYSDVAEFQFLRASLFVELLLWRDQEAFDGAVPFGDRRADHGGGV